MNNNEEKKERAEEEEIPHLQGKIITMMKYDLKKNDFLKKKQKDKKEK